MAEFGGNCESMDAMFGDDSDNEVTTEGNTEPSSLASNQPITSTRDDRNASSDSSLLLSNPLFEVRFLSESNGSQQLGLFAKVDLPPGVLVLSEIPTLHWPAGTEFRSSSDDKWIQCLRSVVSNQAAVQVTKFLFPRELLHCKAVEIDQTKRYLEEIFDKSAIEIAVELDMPFVEIVRIFLVLQHNGFESGLYRYLTILNHSCAPNCIKYAPTVTSFGASEIWTTQHIRSGEELVICYVEPIGQNPLSIREYLSKNHNFQCNCSFCSLPFNCSVSSIDINIAICLNNWQTKLDKLEKRLVGFERQTVSLLSKASMIPKPIAFGSQQFNEVVKQVIELSIRLQTYITRIVKIKEEMFVSTRTTIHPNILKYFYHKCSDILRSFSNLFLDLTVNYFKQLVTESKRLKIDLSKIAIDPAYSFDQLGLDVANVLVLSLTSALEDIVVVCFGAWHPLVATALGDVTTAMDRVIACCKLNVVLPASLSTSISSSGSSSSSDLNTPFHVLMNNAALLPTVSWATSLVAFQQQRQRVSELAEQLRKRYVTARNYSDCIRTQSRGKAGSVYWGNSVCSAGDESVEREIRDIFVGLKFMEMSSNSDCFTIDHNHPRDSSDSGESVLRSDVELMTVSEWIDSLSLIADESDEAGDGLDAAEVADADI